MRLTLLMVPACLVLAGCVAEESGGLLASAPQTAQTPVVATFQPPADAPVPVARPNFGDRTALASARPAATAASQTAAATTTVVAQSAPQAAAESVPAAVAASAGPAEQPAAEPALAYADARPAPTLAGYQDEIEAEEHIDDDKPLQPGPVADGQRWRIAYPYVRSDCFPEDLKRALTAIGQHYNQDVLVISGARSNGRRGSMHRSCRAADIRVPGVAPTALAAYAKSVPGINGVGTYRRSTVTHIDVRAERFAWRY